MTTPNHLHVRAK